MPVSYRDLLKEFISFKSVSTSKDYQKDIKKTVEWLSQLFEDHGFEVEIIEGYDNPIVLAKYKVSEDYETALIYGHYDVQPASKEDGWDSDPFELSEKDGRLFARGVVDNKGQVAVHIKTIFELIEKGILKYNIKFFIEGNEETGSPNLADCIRDKKDKLGCDFVMISDGELTSGHPVIEAGFRGGFNSTLKVVTSHKELHSGIYGSASPCASHELVKFLEKLHKVDGSVAISDFYKNVDEIEDKILKMNQNMPFDLDEYKKLSGTQALLTENDYDFFTQVGLRPAVIVTGIESGYTGDGYRNSIPPVATAKINFRLVKSQKPDQIVKLFRNFVKSELPEYVDYELDVADPYDGVKLDLDNQYIELAEDYLNKAFNKKVLKKFCGGGLPIVTLFDEILGVPQVLAPLGNEDCNMHAVGENYRTDVLEKALKFSEMFWSKM